MPASGPSLRGRGDDAGLPLVLAGSEKARLQLDLEQRFARFEEDALAPPRVPRKIHNNNAMPREGREGAKTATDGTLPAWPDHGGYSQ
jgi:hypothetical protein